MIQYHRYHFFSSINLILSVLPVLGNESIHFNINYSELEGLLGFPFSQKGDFKKGDNVDNFTESGIYAVNTLPDEDDSNTPINLGILLVFKSKINSAQGGRPILQIMYEYNGSKFLFRNFWDDQWFDWKEVNMQDLLL